MTNEPMKLYFAPTPNGWKITIMLAELELPYELCPIHLGKGEQFSEEFLTMNPNHRIPVLTDDEGPDGKPITLFESGAILLWLADKSGRLLPAHGGARYRVLQWLFWQVGGLGPMAGQLSHFINYAPDDQPYSLKRYSLEFERLLAVMERGMENCDWLAGDNYSIADISSFPWVVPYKRFNQGLHQFPRVRAWFDRMKERAAVRAGIDVGKEYRTQISDGRRDEEARKTLFGQGAERILKRDP